MFKESSVTFAIGLLQFLQILGVGNAVQVRVRANGKEELYEGSELSGGNQIQFPGWSNDKTTKIFPPKTVFDYDNFGKRAVVSSVEDVINFENLKIKLTNPVIREDVVVDVMEANKWTLKINVDRVNRVRHLQSILTRGVTVRFEAQNFNLGILSDEFLLVKTVEPNQTVCIVTAEVYSLITLQKYGQKTTYEAKWIPCGNGVKLEFTDPENVGKFAKGDLFRYSAVGSDFSKCPLRVATKSSASWAEKFSSDFKKVTITSADNETFDGILFLKEETPKKLVVGVEEEGEFKISSGTEQFTDVKGLLNIFKAGSKVKVSEVGQTGIDYTVYESHDIVRDKYSMRTKVGCLITCNLTQDL